MQKKSDVPSLSTYQPTMSDFRPIMLNLPTYLKSDVINGRSLKVETQSQKGTFLRAMTWKFVQKQTSTELKNREKFLSLNDKSI